WISVGARTYILEEILERNDREISWVAPADEGGPMMDIGKEPVEFLLESGILVEDGSRFTVEADTDLWSVGSGDANVNQALNFVLMGADVDWISGWDGSALDISNQFSRKFNEVKMDVYGQLKFDKDDIQNIVYERHARDPE